MRQIRCYVHWCVQFSKILLRRNQIDSWVDRVENFVDNGFLLNSINDTIGAMFEWQGADLNPRGKGIYTNTVLFNLEITYQYIRYEKEQNLQFALPHSGQKFSKMCQN